MRVQEKTATKRHKKHKETYLLFFSCILWPYREKELSNLSTTMRVEKNCTRFHLPHQLHLPRLDKGARSQSINVDAAGEPPAVKTHLIGDLLIFSRSRDTATSLPRMSYTTSLTSLTAGTCPSRGACGATENLTLVFGLNGFG